VYNIVFFWAVFSGHFHATFWLGIEQCSNRSWNLVPDESGPRSAWHMYQKLVLEKWRPFMAPVSGACVMSISYCLQKMSYCLIILLSLDGGGMA